MFKKSTTVNLEDLKEAIPLRNLPERILRYVASLGALEHASRKQKLFGIGEQTDDVFYLLKGEVMLRTADGLRPSAMSWPV